MGRRPPFRRPQRPTRYRIFPFRTRRQDRRCRRLLDTVLGKVNFVDINAGDTPTVSTQFNSFTYQNAQHQNVTATLNAKQLADIAAVAVKLALVPDPGNNNNGSATWTYSVPDNAFDFLAAGETATLTYKVKVDNNFAPNDEATTLSFTITVTGTNDAPVISTGPQTVTFAAGKTTPGGDLTTNVPTSGTLSFTDVDLTDTHTVSTKLASAVLSGRQRGAWPAQRYLNRHFPHRLSPTAPERVMARSTGIWPTFRSTSRTSYPRERRSRSPMR